MQCQIRGDDGDKKYIMPYVFVFPCLYCLLLRLWCFTEVHKITACGSKTVHGGNKQTTIKHNTHIISN